MFGAKQHVRNYLKIIRPWAMGKENRGWKREDFFDHETQNPDADWVPKKDVYEGRTDPSHVIFALRPYDITTFDRLFLSANILKAIMDLNQAITSFNTTLDMVNNAQSADVKWNRTVLLHVGVIGALGGFGVHDRFKKLDILLSGTPPVGWMKTGD